MNTVTRTTVSRTLDNDRLQALAPAVFANAAHDSRSDRYHFVPTIDAVNALRETGFHPVFARQSRSRDRGRVGHAKHMIRFRREEDGLAVGDVFPEVVLVNSHDGSSSYQLSAGMFRLICGNGMVVADETFASISVSHGRSQVEQLVSGSQRVLEGAVENMKVIGQWSQRRLEEREQLAFAEAAHHLRFADDATGEVHTPVTPRQLLTPRRDQDSGDNLWKVFNRVQENAIKGGLTATGRTKEGRRRRVTSREVAGIDGNVKLNKALWILATRLAQGN